MPQKTLGPTTKALRLALLIAGPISLLIGVLAWFQSQRERDIDLDDIYRRAHVLVYQLSEEVLESLGQPGQDVSPGLGARLEGYRRLIGFAVLDPAGRILASGKAVPEFAEEVKGAAEKALRERGEVVEMARSHGTHLHVLAKCLTDQGGSVRGALAALHDLSHLDARATGRLVEYAFWTLLLSILLATLVAGATWLAYDRPLRNLAQWMRRLRMEDAPEAPPPGVPGALLASESNRLAASFRAARSASRVQSRAEVREHNVWPRERLRAHAIDCLEGGQLVVVSNREPYMHQLKEGRPRVIVPAGGLVTALDPVLQACGGLWVAHGAGDADRETSDPDGRLTVPPGDPRYTLRRVWLSKEEEQGYYYGLANEGFWPLCHLAHERPTFRASDWEHYVRANRRFADAVLEEIGSGPATVLAQDYHLALLPQMLKASRPDLRIGLFWHIPWPNPEAFRICPWRSEILAGMLGADLVGFHLQQYSNNFLDTVDRMVEARLDWDHFTVELRGHTSLIRPFPISVESWSERAAPSAETLERQIAQLREEHKLGGGTIAVGVDRIDYTKGIPERFRAVARFLEKHPQHRERFTFVELGAPSRTHLQRYRQLVTELETLTDQVNWRFQTDSWKPIHLLVGHHDSARVYAFMRMASACIVSSLHDGMNLVAKEYVAAKEDGEGVLILSEFAGAARELSDALIINPYDTEGFAEAIRAAVEMDPAERRSRMERLRRVVEEHNVYRWAGQFLSELREAAAPKHDRLARQGTQGRPPGPPGEQTPRASLRGAGGVR